MWLFILFFTVPVIEIVLFIKIGNAIGLMPTLFVILITALAGTFFVKQQASQLFNLFKRQAGNLEDPSEPIGHGVLVLFAGALLLTPGFFTDVVGFLLLVPNFRYWIFKQIEKRIFHIRSFNKETHKKSETIYDADYTDVTPKNSSLWNKNPKD
tara:strand:- start:2482 stop:2943 length:462 start_codon:yes stop_codon:yes gene_type:complete